MIIGASRGLGLGLATEYLNRGWNVIATERKAGSSAGLYHLSAKAGDHLKIEHIDINETDQISELYNRLAGQKLDLLFVNAGVIDDLSNIGEVKTEEFSRLMITNALSPMRMVETFDKMVNPNGSIAVMTSLLGSISNNTSGGYEVYRASKAALNMLMRSYAARTGNIRNMMTVHPGHVQTDMGGKNAPLSVEVSVKGIADSINVNANKKGLKFIDYNNTEIEW